MWHVKLNRWNMWNSYIMHLTSALQMKAHGKNTWLSGTLKTRTIRMLASLDSIQGDTGWWLQTNWSSRDWFKRLIREQLWLKLIPQAPVSLPLSFNITLDSGLQGNHQHPNPTTALHNTSPPSPWQDQLQCKVNSNPVVSQGKQYSMQACHT